jgi:hypothetical protein
VCFHDVLVYLLAAPYQGKYGFPHEVLATRFKDTVYLKSRTTKTKLELARRHGYDGRRDQQQGAHHHDNENSFHRSYGDKFANVMFVGE